MRRFNFNPVHLFYTAPIFAFGTCLAIYIMLRDFVGRPWHHIVAFGLLGVFTLIEVAITWYVMTAVRAYKKHDDDTSDGSSDKKYRDVAVVGE